MLWFFRRLATACAAAVGIASTFAATADAAYNVVACAGTNNSWVLHRTSPDTYLTAFANCPAGTPDPMDDVLQGIGIVDRVDPAGGPIVPADHRFAEHRFTAPPGTRITEALVTRDVGNRSEFWRNYGRIDGVDRPGESCYRPQGQSYCRIAGPRSFEGLNAETIAYGIRCDSPGGECYNGSTLHMVWALVLSATVTLDDTEAPTVSAPASTGLADGAWHRGAGVVTFSSEDNTGVRVRRLVEGAVTRATEVASGCGVKNVGVAYTFTRPCAGDRGLNGTRDFSVSDVCSWGDGEHFVRASVEDTGGGRATSSVAVSVKVDCTAPAVDVAAGNVGGVVRPAVSATDVHAGVASTEVEVQVGSGGAWATYAGPIAARAGSAYRFRARATDAAGNLSAWVPSAWVQVAPPKRATPPPAPPTAPPPTHLARVMPAPVFQPPVAPPPTHTTKPAPSARVTRARFNRRTRTLRVTGTAAHTTRVLLKIRAGKKTIRRKAAVRNGRFTLTLKLPKRTRRAKVMGIRPEPLR